MSPSLTVTELCDAKLEFEEHFADEHVTQRPHGRRIPISQRQSSILSNSSLAASAAAQAAGSSAKSREICFVVREPPFSVLTVSPDPLYEKPGLVAVFLRETLNLVAVFCICSKENPKMGVSRVLWSEDSTCVVTKSDQMPHNLWIWQTETMKLHCLLSFMHPVRLFRWDSSRCQLAVCTGTNRVYIWSVDGISWIDIPNGTFSCRELPLCRLSDW